MSATRPLSAMTLGLMLAVSASFAAPVGAQTVEPSPVARRSSWEVLASSGALVPTGAQRNALKDGALSTAQLLYVTRSRIAISSTLGWARSRDLASAGTPKLSVFTYDVGLEARGRERGNASGLTLTPFAGAGAGGRSYDLRGRDADARHNLAGYASLGGELGAGRVRLRLEARDYVSGFKPLAGSGRSATRQDVALFAGLRFTRKRTSN